MSAKKRPTQRTWARDQFSRYKGCVAYIETRDDAGNINVGTCFHVGDGAFVTARHVIEGRELTKIGFDDGLTGLGLIEKPEDWGPKQHGDVNIVSGPHFLRDNAVDVACFKAKPFPKRHIPLGGHFNEYLGQYDLVLHRTLVLGYPPIPFSNRPALVASVGEVNALIDKYTGGHPHFVISVVARGGFSGAPALVAYDEQDHERGTAALGLVTEALGTNNRDPELGFAAVLTVEPIYDCLEQAGILPPYQRVREL